MQLLHGTPPSSPSALRRLVLPVADTPILRGTGVAFVVSREAQRFTIWNGRNDGGRPLASGTYFYQLQVVGRFGDSQRLLALR
jgi:hypothetical protein